MDVPEPAAPVQFEHEHHHHHEVQVPQYINTDVPIPNNVPWYFLTLATLVGAAILARGLSMTVKRWAIALHSQRIPSIGVIVEMASILLATILGALTGYLVWHASLGSIIAFVGSWGSQWILDQVTNFLLRFKKK